MKTRKCPRCGQNSNIIRFYKCTITSKNPTGLSTYCIECQKIVNRENYEANKEKEKIRSRTWKKNHPDQYKKQYTLQNKRDMDYQKQWREDNQVHRAIQRANWYKDNPSYNKQYYEKNKDSVRKQKARYDKNRRATDPSYKLSKNLRTRLYHAIRGNIKAGSAVKDMGCTAQELKQYLESKFQPGMTWDNYGKNGWHVDHIIPLKSFDLTQKEEFLKACRYTNLQPLWAKEHLEKTKKER